MPATPDAARAGWERGRLTARPHATGLPPGPTSTLVLDRPGLLVPRQRPAGPLPLVVLLHGAGADPRMMLPVIAPEAERRGVIVLAPKSAGSTWDVIRGGFGPDVAALDTALTQVFGEFDVDPERIAIAGFSDGASYALSLGLTNGTLFRRVIAFSPGFFVAPDREGRPGVFISHGRADPVLPIERCSRRLVPALRAEGYDVDYREFDGGHTVPLDLVAEALTGIA